MHTPLISTYLIASKLVSTSKCDVRGTYHKYQPLTRSPCLVALCIDGVHCTTCTVCTKTYCTHLLLIAVNISTLSVQVSTGRLLMVTCVRASVDTSKQWHNIYSGHYVQDYIHVAGDSITAEKHFEEGRSTFNCLIYTGHVSNYIPLLLYSVHHWRSTVTCAAALGLPNLNYTYVGSEDTLEVKTWDK